MALPFRRLVKENPRAMRRCSAELRLRGGLRSGSSAGSRGGDFVSGSAVAQKNLQTRFAAAGETAQHECAVRCDLCRCRSISKGGSPQHRLEVWASCSDCDRVAAPAAKAAFGVVPSGENHD